jgi:hypothetical protein
LDLIQDLSCKSTDALRFPARIVMNNQTFSVFQSDDYKDLYF